jgi:GH43 family beta-xylosidase
VIGFTFLNPLLPTGADPWALAADGYYYYTHTTHSNITLWKTDSIGELRQAERRVIWSPERKRPWSKNIWAPELHRINGKWFIYFAADDGHNRNHRLWILECDGADPMSGSWTLRGELRTPENCWAIDGTVLQHETGMYLLWSGWEGTENGCQNIYIARMSNPWTVEGDRVLISTPEHAWEKHGRIRRPGPDDKPVVLVNEGPAVLVRNGRIFVTYSASGSWTDEYKLGLLWADASSNLLDPQSWRKRSEPAFFASGVPGTFAAGHNSFFTSPDGAEDWILYHANPKPNQGWSKRAPRAQRFTWTSDGFPCFGAPAALDQPHFEPAKAIEKPAVPEFGDLAWIPPFTETPVLAE